jgi:RraA family protein
MKDYLKKVEKMDTAVLSDAMHRLGTMTAAIKPLVPEFPLVGLAFTVRCYPGDFLTMIKALKEAKAGEVLVVDGGGFAEAAVMGEMMAWEAKKKKLKGFVIDGAVRDIKGLREVGLPVYARAVTPRAGSVERVEATQIPIICGGAPVQPGDVVVGDEDGVVIISSKQKAHFLELAHEIAKKEKEIIKKLKDGKSLADILDLAPYLAQQGKVPREPRPFQLNRYPKR